AATVTVTLGNADCEGFSEGEFFCMPDDDGTESNEKKLIYSCNADNTIITTTDCSTLDGDGSDWYCTEASPGYAVCKDAGGCNVWSLTADPFGLYYEKDSCYGTYSSSTGYENYCYYDYTNTVSDKCYSCAEFETCFDYQSQDSCELNNCLGVGCAWLPATVDEIEEMVSLSNLFPVTEQTGHGYCIEEEYEEDDYCSLCGPDADLFENSYCTPEICVNLGRCFSEEDLTLCNECGDKASTEANCYEYTSELECIGDQDIENNVGEITLSDDRCDWGRCNWAASDNDLSGGYCFKDGDANEVEDCAEFSAGEYTSCKIDNTAPSTSLGTTSFAVVSTAYPNVTFTGVDDANAMGTLSYCLSSSLASDCENFETVDYPGLLSEESLTIDVNNSTFLQNKIISGETYLLRFYSKDKYHNQESVQETYVYVDNELPDFNLETYYETSADISDLTIYLSEPNEAMSCDFTLVPVLPEGSNTTISFERDEEKEYEFTGLNGVIYDISVTCTDDHGNENTEVETIVFDLEQDITLIYPEYDGAVAETSIEFEVETAVSANCELYQLNSATGGYDFVAGFESTDAEDKQHKTDAISGFYEGEYAGTVKVICLESLTDDYIEDYFFFRVDFTAPETQIVLTEGEREEKPTGYAWEEYFIEEVVVSFECDDDGFACDKTYYCLGEGCEYSGNEGYKEYTETFSVTNTTKVCYYSTDLGGSSAYPDCGTIIIEGFGIKLINPNEYYYLSEMWGVSNKPTFDWEVMSKLDTDGCTFDLNSEFDYLTRPQLFTFDSSDNENYYIKENFPNGTLSDYDTGGSTKELYVKCIDYQDEVGPAQKMNLEYDPTAPEITSSYADPYEVFEGIETYIYSVTDDKTICKFSDDSDSAGSAEFDTMEYSFPGYDDNTLDISHVGTFGFSFEGATKDYTVNVQCSNGAGDLSEVAVVTFSVDYTASGYIVSTSPSGYINYSDITLGVQTNKNAQCYFDDSVFESTGGTSHSSYIGSLDEGQHHYLVSCLVGENNRESEIDFIIDFTPPTITSVDDGTYSCGLDEVKLLVYTDEANISSYYYELYEGVPEGASSTLLSFLENITSNDTSTTTAVQISTGTLPAENKTTIENLDLEENKTYYVLVSAGDAAGNWGELATSDGFTAVDDDYSICALDDDNPAVSLNTNSTCTATNAELHCDDEVGCSELKYGTSSSSSTCSPDNVYFGNKVPFTSSGWICYYVEDNTGNNGTGSKKVTFSDADGDGVADSCDSCSGTTAGKAVDAEGCSFGQVPDSEQTNDQDEDGLPDYWEKLFDKVNCELSYVTKDSDSDGTFDGDQDYDGDGLVNYEEYRKGYDPCVADAPADDGSEVDVIYEPGAGGVSDEKGVDYIAWTLFILGLLLTLGGIGYLVYFYGYNPKGKAIFSGKQLPSAGPPGTAPRARPVTSQPIGEVTAKPGFLSNLKDKIAGLKKSRAQKVKQLEREKLFSGFNQQSPEFHHFKDIMQSRKPEYKKVEDLVNRYQEHKEVIRPGLKPGEKSLFNRLDQIAKKTEEKPVSKVVSKKDAQDIFKKLKALSEKRQS
ncbi:MAG: hypothetical protein KJ896_01485, partial [Nanoarchaeota archaeon]|nr:hypothetical protein [Nanoarchaeota archaeon]